MADEQITPTEVETPVPTAPDVTADAPATEVAADAGGGAEGEPHPLEPGGKRFNEVYRRMAEAERERARLEGEVAALRQPAPQAVPQPQAPRFYTEQQLQALVDASQITPALMASQLAWQAKEQAKAEIRGEFQQERVTSSASNEINQYIDKLPTLRDRSSDDYRKVEAAAREISSEMGLPLSDLRVQRRALRETFGKLDRLEAVRNATQHARDRVESHADTSAGVSSVRQPSKDPLRDVPRDLKAHWDRLNYTQEQRLAEAKWITRR